MLHGSHAVAEFESRSAEPSAHGSHIVDVAEEPGAHVEHGVVESKSASYMLPVQGVQDVAPPCSSVSVALPGAHTKHAVATFASWSNSPAGH